MNRSELLEWWDEAFNETVWWAAWRKAIEGLSAEEAAWSPTPGRHSIWQIVNHLMFWHEYFVHRNTGGEPKTLVEIDVLNWQDIDDVSEDAWQRTCDQFIGSHARVRELLTDPAVSGAPPKPEFELRYLLFHGCYHIGQIMYIRALLGKEALES